ncbi:MAG TPA: hypothetical protein VFE27_23065 [Acidobacteriaceae bacterium]|nr:hypothetical protein [Acidobacteriaceae bacterium]
MITSGSAGSIACATAGCIAGSDPKNIYQLPDTTGMKGEVIIMGGRSVWDSCIRLTGAKLIVAPTVKDLNSAITSQTAMIYTTWHDDDHITQILKISKAAGVPLMVDQAAGGIETVEVALYPSIRPSQDFAKPGEHSLG